MLTQVPNINLVAGNLTKFFIDSARQVASYANLSDRCELKRVPVVPFWLAYRITAIRWKFFGSLAHPTCVDAIYSSAGFSNAKLKAAGWQPHYSSREALISALK